MEASPNGKNVDGPDALEGAWSVADSAESRSAYSARVDDMARDQDNVV